MMQGKQMKKPGITQQEKEAAHQRISAVLDKTRGLSDMEFEVEKDALCKQLKGDDPVSISERKRRFRAAYFLLVPGLDDMYTEVIGRIDGESKT